MRRTARAPLRQPRRSRGRPDHLHADAEPPRRHRVRLHRHAAGRGAVLDRHRHRVRQPRPRVDAPPPARRRERDGHRRHLALACFGLWGPRSRSPPAAHPQDLSFPYMSLHELTVGDVPVRALRVTYVGELGWELYCRASTARACGRRSGRPGRRTASSRAVTGRSTRCGWRRATGSGAPTSRRTRRRTRAGSASA